MTRLQKTAGFVFLLALAYSLTIQVASRALYGGELYKGYLFQPWSGDEMMQTLSWQELSRRSLSALWFNHVQPPMLDGIRLFLGRIHEFFISKDSATAKDVDIQMYFFYSILFAAIATLIFIWVAGLTQKLGIGLITAAAFVVYPANLAYSTLLEGTYLSTFMVTTFFVVLFFALRNKSAGLLLASISLLTLLTLTRNIFAVPLLVVLVVLYVLYLTIHFRQWQLRQYLVAFIFLATLFLLPLKQWIMFDTWSPTSFSGDHLAQSFGLNRPSVCPQEGLGIHLDDTASRLATRVIDKWNTPDQLALNNCLEQATIFKILDDPVGSARYFFSTVPFLMDRFLDAPDAQYLQMNRAASLIPLGSLSKTGYAFLFLGGISLLILLAFATYSVREIRTFLTRYWLFFAVLTVALWAAVLFSNNSVGVEPNRYRFIFEPTILSLGVISISRIASTLKRRLQTGRRRASIIGVQPLL